MLNPHLSSARNSSLGATTGHLSGWEKHLVVSLDGLGTSFGSFANQVLSHHEFTRLIHGMVRFSGNNQRKCLQVRGRRRRGFSISFDQFTDVLGIALRAHCPENICELCRIKRQGGADWPRTSRSKTKTCLCRLPLDSLVNWNWPPSAVHSGLLRRPREITCLAPRLASCLSPKTH